MRKSTSVSLAAMGDTGSTVNAAMVGRIQTIRSESGRAERNFSVATEGNCVGWKDGALGPEQFTSSLSPEECVFVGLLVVSATGSRPEA